MTPQWHDEFVALCALFASGELTEEEWALLQVHLAYCDSCRQTFEEYRELAEEVIPALAVAAYSESTADSRRLPFSLDAAEQRLMSRVDSLPSSREPERRRPASWKTYSLLLAASAACVAGIIGMRLIHPKEKARTTPISIATTVQSAPLPPATATVETGKPPRTESAEHEIATLRQQLSTAESLSRQSSAGEANAERRLAAELEERKSLIEERDTLSQQLAVARAETQSLEDRSTQASAIALQQSQRNVQLETRLHDLNAALEDKDRLLGLDKEFLAHDREIRDLIGARDLYIADIYDVAQNGKTSKPFGRIFYTKDRSLVFYGYDLDKQAGLRQSVAFQAWGSGDDKQNVSLGLFYQDDTHKRWVLRFNDTKTLARLNMVFVTAEPQGGSSKPTGKPLLQAYLQLQPNHP